MAFDRQAAKQAGYTDEEIDAFLQSNPQAQKQEARQPGPVAPDTEPPAPATVITEPGAGLASTATTAGLAAAPYAIPAAGAAAAAYGGSKLYGAWNASAQAAQALAKSQADQAAARLTSEQGIANRFQQRMNPQMARPGPGSFGPGTTMPTAPYQAPVSGPVAPSGAPAQQAMNNSVRQAAAQRITGFGAGGMAVPAAVGAGGAAATGIAGGQMAAMTPEQRKAYYDSMMLGAMSGDAGLAAAIMNRGQ